MSNWKQQIKEFIKKAELASAVKLMESNGLKTGITESEAGMIERDVTQKEFSETTWKLLQILGGTNRPMPEYLK
jgi:hypothetical protein